MNASSVGDLANFYMLRRRTTETKQNIDQLTQELSSGMVADTKAVLGGNVGYLTEIERDMRSLSSFDISTTEAGQFTSVMQQTLGSFQDTSAEFSSRLYSSLTGQSSANLDDLAEQARDELNVMISLLNGEAAGRSLFAGAATNTTPLISSDDLLTELRTVAAGATTAADLDAAVTAWFDDPAGFAAVAYQGSGNSLAPMNLSETERVRVEIKADDQVFRDVLRTTALAALADDPTFALSTADKSEIITATAGALLASQDDIIRVRGLLGATEERIEEIKTRNAAHRSSLEVAKSALLGADPFETATRLEEAQFQLESLYSVTVRMSNLKLVNFLR
ncbi:MAG: flagellin [Pseudomonadota bacterium]